MAYSPHGSRIVYPSLPETLTEDDLARLSTVTSEEWAWVRGVARRGPPIVALLGHLKMFQHVGRFLSVADLPSAAISHVAKQIHLEVPSDLGYDRRTLCRHHQAVRQYLGITLWGAKARRIASTAIGFRPLPRSCGKLHWTRLPDALCPLLLPVAMRPLRSMPSTSTKPRPRFAKPRQSRD